MVRIAAIRTLYTPRKDGIIRVSPFGVAAAFVLRGPCCYLNSVADRVPSSFTLLLYENIGHCTFLSETRGTRNMMHLYNDMGKSFIGKQSQQQRQGWHVRVLKSFEGISSPSSFLNWEDFNLGPGMGSIP